MNALLSEVSSLESVDYPQLVDALSRELERAMQAIIHNSLTGLEDSVANQEALSIQVARSVGDLSRSAKGDEETSRQMRIAAVELERQSNCYAALIRHSSNASALMLSLFRSFRGESQEASDSRLRFHAWSCEM